MVDRPVPVRVPRIRFSIFAIPFHEVKWGAKRFVRIRGKLYADTAVRESANCARKLIEKEGGMDLRQLILMSVPGAMSPNPVGGSEGMGRPHNESTDRVYLATQKYGSS
jgi:hypothetical protein